MSYVDLSLFVVGLVAVIWWVMSANFSSCDECDHNCNQGRNCPRRKKDEQG